MTAIRVFIGSEPKTEIATRVLEHSILKHTSSKVEFPGLLGEKSWKTRDEANAPQQHKSQGTGFSLLRWDIPRRCNYEGYAIHLDADMIVFSDILDLWQSDKKYPNENCSIWCSYQMAWGYTRTIYPDRPTPNTEVMLIDCARAKTNQQTVEEILKDLDTQKGRDRKKYAAVMRAQNHKHPAQEISAVWNHLNVYKPGKTKLLHYTIEPQQPWYNPPGKHPLDYLWKDLLLEAIEAGRVTKEECIESSKTHTPHRKNFRGYGLHPGWVKLLS
jgi:hypothetical protein